MSTYFLHNSEIYGLVIDTSWMTVNPNNVITFTPGGVVPSGVTTFNTRTGAVALSSADVTTALTFTPYSAANPTGYQTAAQVATAVATETTRATTAEALLASTTSVTTAVATETTRATTAEALLAPKASPTFTGTPALPGGTTAFTQTAGNNTTALATTAFVTAAVVAATSGVASFNTRTGAVTLSSSDVTTALTFTPANIASPTFTGTPAAPTVAATSAAGTTQIATTAFVRNGTTTNDSAVAGQVGEYISASVAAGSALSVTNNVALNVTSISLTAGDWDVGGTVAFTAGTNTNITVLEGWTSATSATAPTDPGLGSKFVHLFPAGMIIASGVAGVFPTGTTRVSVASTTTIFLSAFANFTASTLTVFGFIGARRAR